MPKQECAEVILMPKKLNKDDFYQGLYKFLLMIKLVYDPDSFMCFLGAHRTTIRFIMTFCQQQFEPPKTIKHRKCSALISDRGKTTKQNNLVFIGTLHNKTKTNSNTQAEV